EKKECPTAAAPAVCENVTAVSGIKIAYVDIDSLFTNYKLSVTMNKEMLRKEENMRMTLTEKAKAIQADYEDFQRKLENNVYSSRQRAEEEQNRILRSQEDYARYEQRLVNELTAETQKNNSILRDSINSFLKEYNSVKGYDLIISRVGDNLLYANSALDITQEVIDGLNSRYAGEK
ncbi:MAG: OmpH family outer membrane protein, partial [Bacteroidaceae bacterium]|nr:OmpH family outer membrane protein [Bacteroidaceae bacterium]